MKLIIKAKECKQLPDGSWQLLTSCEDFKEALKAHSPNIVVEYLNENYAIQIATIRKWKKAGRKEDGNGNV